jgi:hypothetical protein
MPSIHTILAALDEREIARRVGLPHDEARMRYPLQRNTVDSFDEFADQIGDYYAYHLSACVGNGGRFPRGEAIGRAKELLDREYRRRHGDIVSAFTDARDSLNSGMRGILDVIADGLKFESIERYIREVFDRHIAPNAWEVKVEIIRQFIRECGANLSSSIRSDQPERYAQNYQDLIRSYINGLRETSSILRRL